MRYDKQAHIVVVLYAVAALLESGRRVSASKVQAMLPDFYMSFPHIVRAMKYLTDIGAIEWEERSRGSRAGKVKAVHPDKISMKFEPSRSAFEREVKAYLDAGWFRWRNGDLVLDGETIVSDEFIKWCKRIDERVTGEWLFNLLDGISLKKLLENAHELK